MSMFNSTFKSLTNEELWDALNWIWNQIQSGQQPDGPLYQELDAMHHLYPELYGEWLNAFNSQGYATSTEIEHEQDIVCQQNNVVRNKMDFIWSQIQFCKQKLEVDQSQRSRITDDFSPDHQFIIKEELDLLHDQLYNLALSNPVVYSEWKPNVPNHSIGMDDKSEITFQDSKDLWTLFELNMIWGQIIYCEEQPDAPDSKDQYLKRLYEQFDELRFQNPYLYRQWLHAQNTIAATSRKDADHQEQAETCEAPHSLPGRAVSFVWQCITSGASKLYGGLGLLKS